MITPQQIQEISFEKAVFGGYNMDSVDDFLEPLTEDYVSLYKENSVLKSKLRILVEKLEEYRRQEAAMQNAIMNAQKAGEQMVAEAEKKSAKILRDAEAAAAAKAGEVEAQLSEEIARLNAAREATRKFMEAMEKRLKRQLELMDELRRMDFKPEQEAPAQEHQPFDFDKESGAPTPEEKADDIIAEIGQHLEENFSAEDEEPSQMPPLTEDTARLPEEGGRRAEPNHTEEKQNRFGELKFGPNYHFSDR